MRDAPDIPASSEIGDVIDVKRRVQPIVDKLRKRAAITDDELRQLQQDIDLLELAAQGSHHHHHHDA